jgi:hypothetical protein
MKLYAAGERQQVGAQTLHICPAAHVGEKAACPLSWFSEDGEPLNFNVTFINGEVEVEDSIGKYLLAYKMARKSRLIIPLGVAA